MEKIIRNGFNMLGVFDGEYAYKGPDCVQIDLTNNCNNNCIACWCNSLLLGDKAISAEVKKQTLDYGFVIKLIDSLRSMRTWELYFSGGGEPLMHPGAVDIICYAKSRGFTCTLHTNFTLVDDNILDKLEKANLDYLVVSLWAATPQMYVKTHPNKTEEDFIRIKTLIKSINEKKRAGPRVRIYNVISNVNYKEIIQMAEFCLDTGSENVEFTVIDTIPGRTDKLLVNEEERKDLLEACRAIKAEKKFYQGNGRFIVSNFDHFIRRVASEHGGQAEYDRGFLDSVPCYVGWTFARILADGNVNSCLKSHRIPIGNVYQDDFRVIWNSAKQREFRKQVCGRQNGHSLLSMIGNDPEKKIGCYKSCDDLGRNMIMHEKVSRLSPYQKKILKCCSGIGRLVRGVYKR